MDLSKREKIGLISFVTIIIIISAFTYFKDSNSDSIMINKNSTANTTESYANNVNTVVKSNEKANEASSNKISVYVSGEVNSPGVYELNAGDRVQQLVNSAGGLTSKADTSNINLALKLKDEDHIIVYSTIQSSIAATSSMAKPLSSNDSPPKDGTILININTADKEELKKLPRIGDVIAQRIIDYRQQNGRFNAIKDITNVSGIGNKVFENIKDKINVQ